VSVQSLPNIDRSTLRERVLQALRAAITSGAYRPGDHLSHDRGFGRPLAWGRR
jgi:DNA-binding GntR family transcriptional regulator